MSNQTLLGFNPPRPKELDYADEADDVVFMRKSAIRMLEYKIRDSRYNLLGYGGFYLFMYIVWALNWTLFIKAEWWYTLLVTLLTSFILFFCVLRFAVNYQDVRAYQDTLFIKRLAWPESSEL